MTTNPVAIGGAVTAADTAAVVGSTTDSRTASPEVKSPAGDTVTLQGKARDTGKNRPREDGFKAGGRIGSVIFAYNSKGDLRVRFMDSANKLVYQTPPVMMARMMDLMLHADSSVSAKV